MGVCCTYVYACLTGCGWHEERRKVPRTKEKKKGPWFDGKQGKKKGKAARLAHLARRFDSTLWLPISRCGCSCSCYAMPGPYTCTTIPPTPSQKRAGRRHHRRQEGAFRGLRLEALFDELLELGSVAGAVLGEVETAAIVLLLYSGVFFM